MKRLYDGWIELGSLHGKMNSGGCVATCAQ